MRRFVDVTARSYRCLISPDVAGGVGRSHLSSWLAVRVYLSDWLRAQVGDGAATRVPMRSWCRTFSRAGVRPLGCAPRPTPKLRGSQNLGSVIAQWPRRRCPGAFPLARWRRSSAPGHHPESLHFPDTNGPELGRTGRYRNGRKLLRLRRLSDFRRRNSGPKYVNRSGVRLP